MKRIGVNNLAACNFNPVINTCWNYISHNAGKNQTKQDYGPDMRNLDALLP